MVEEGGTVEDLIAEDGDDEFYGEEDAVGPTDFAEDQEKQEDQEESRQVFICMLLSMGPCCNESVDSFAFSAASI
jgi:hypothetical protein